MLYEKATETKSYLITRIFQIAINFIYTSLLSISCNNELYGIFPTIVYALSVGIIIYKLRSPTEIYCFSNRYTNTNTVVQLHWTDRILEDLTLFGLFILTVHSWLLTTRVTKWFIDQIALIILDITSDQSENVVVSFLLFVQGQKDFVHSTICWCLCIVPSNYAGDQILNKLYCEYLNTPYEFRKKNLPMLTSVMNAEKAIVRVYNYSKCGDDFFSVLPTAIAILSAARVICYLTFIMFRRSIFRRIPWWESCLQNTINCMLTAHSIKAWKIYVTLTHWIVYSMANQYKHAKGNTETLDRTFGVLLDDPYSLHQTVCWLTSLAILYVTLCVISQSDDTPHLLIWIATSPWHHTEIGPTAYYLHRPIPPAAARMGEADRKALAVLRQTQSTNTLRPGLQAPRPVDRSRSKSL